MARISGIVIPNEKQVQIALTYIYGIGPKFARDILAAAKVEPTTRVKISPRLKSSAFAK